MFCAMHFANGRREHVPPDAVRPAELYTGNIAAASPGDETYVVSKLSLNAARLIMCQDVSGVWPADDTT
jgi:hypothetical protein